jgi:creatinine amidohydrolase/Fe(II)-dependent formamide hydrolase-like protein
MTDRALILPDMTWPEAQEALAQAKVALVPVGSFEQHGPSGTSELDTGRAYGFGRPLAPRTVTNDALAPGEFKGRPYPLLGEGYNLGYHYRFDEITANGALGDATQASEELGWAIVEQALARAVEFLDAFLAEV